MGRPRSTGLLASAGRPERWARSVAPRSARRSSSSRPDDILRTARNAERVPRDIPEPGAAAVSPPKLEAIADDYRKLFATCQIKEANRTDVQWYVSKIVDPARRKSYEQVFEETCVPWYFVAIIHGMEGGFDTKAHLHNGDPLKAKTVQVPKGRPTPWNPPSVTSGRN